MPTASKTMSDITEHLDREAETAADRPPFKTGDRVTIRSGGPTLTVLDVGRHTGLVFCRWLHSDGSTWEDSFPAAALVRDPRGIGF